MRNPLSILRDASHLLAPLTAYCRDFNNRWERGAGAVSPAGRWSGEWRSEASGRSGRLWCVLEPDGENRWRATFRAGYAGVLRACYCTSLSVDASDERWTFRGRSDLGRFAGGVYEYDGEATTEHFLSSYRNRYDHGTFELRRDAGSPTT